MARGRSRNRNNNSEYPNTIGFVNISFMAADEVEGEFAKAVRGEITGEELVENCNALVKTTPSNGIAINKKKGADMDIYDMFEDKLEEVRQALRTGDLDWRRDQRIIQEHLTVYKIVACRLNDFDLNAEYEEEIRAGGGL